MHATPGDVADAVNKDTWDIAILAIEASRARGHARPALDGTRRIAELALAARLPSMAAYANFTEAGGLMSYNSSYAWHARAAAGFVDKILKGARPGELPVQQPTQFELAINLRSAKALGLTIPQSLLVRADEVIE